MLLLLLPNALATDETLVTDGAPEPSRELGWDLAADGDLNGDGYDDVIAATALGQVSLYYGSAFGLAGVTPIPVSSTASGATFVTGRAGGDVDGDGFDDLVVCAESTVDLYRGAATGIDSAAPESMAFAGGPAGSLPTLARGDLDGDGDDDVVSYGLGTATWLPGEAGGLGAATTLTASDGDTEFGAQVTGAGDADGDGCDDVVVSSWTGKVWLLSGCDARDELAFAAPDGSADATFGQGLGGGGDVDADGYTDVVVGTGSESAWLVRGAASGLDVAGGAAIVTGDGSAGSFGFPTFDAFDADGDGFDDVVVSAATTTVDGLQVGAAWLYRGGPEGLDAGEQILASDGADQDHFGYGVAGGDVDGDLLDELLIGAFARQVDGVEDAGGFYVYDLASADGDGDGWFPADDCDDADPDVYPGAVETCDHRDEDCDGLVDDDDPDVTGTSTFHIDADGDDYGGEATTTACWRVEGLTVGSADCDDTDATISPVATEICNGVDDDCDDRADDDDPDVEGQGTWYTDEDGDGFPGTEVIACEQPDGGALEATDCDDEHATVNPDAQEVCDGTNTDQDCDGLVDTEDPDSDTHTFYKDVDGDGYAGSEWTTEACARPDGYYAAADDCDDLNAAVNPGATEVCDVIGIDEDCDGVANPDGAQGSHVMCADDDGDGYGDPSERRTACNVGDGWASNCEDCNDADAEIPELYDLFAGDECGRGDEDCDGVVDEDCSGGGGALCGCCDDNDGGGACTASFVGLGLLLGSRLRRRRAPA